MSNAEGRETDRTALDLLIRGFQVSRLIRLVADLALADKIPPDGRCDARELAADCAVQPTPLLRSLRALAAFGIFRVTADGMVAHTARSLLLRSDAPGTLHHAARFWTTPGSWKAWGVLDEALYGRIPHQVAWNTGRFQYLREHPEEARLFDTFMAHGLDDRHAAIAAAYDFSGGALIADIGGGNGETLRRILARFPGLRGIVFDREDVVGAIQPSQRLEGRIDVEGGNFFERVPSGADIYLLVRVLHDWPDEDCVRILRTIRKAAPGTARLLTVDQILQPDPALGDPSDYLIDMQMMAMFGTGRERTEAEFDDLFSRSGFGLVRVIPTNSHVSIIEAVPR